VITRVPGSCVFLFFFQAEDGIRDATVTGVQTCALPILAQLRPRADGVERLPTMLWIHGGGFAVGSGAELRYDGARLAARGIVVEIGRASCRERAESCVVSVSARPKERQESRCGWCQSSP